MSSLRRIEPLVIPDLAMPDLGALPELVWVAPTDLWVDGTYQRDVSDRSRKLLKKVAGQFSWNKMKPPIGARTDGVIHLIDGQHTAIAAATLKIPLIPVFIVAAEALQERARSFVAHNTDRVTVAPLAVYRALVASGDPDALVCEAVVRKVGIRFRAINQLSELKLGDTGAFGAVQGLVKTHGPLRARVVLETLVAGERAPITAHEIKAALQLLWLNDKRLSPEALASAIRIDGDEGLMAAHARAKQIRSSVWRVLIERWSRRVYDKAA
jgi:hypothetical protein